MDKNSIGKAAVGLVAVAGVSLSISPPANAAEAPNRHRTELNFAGVDANGRDINDVVWDGESCTKGVGDLNWNCQSLTDYNWSAMYGYSHTEFYNADYNSNGAGAPISESTLSRDLPMTDTGNTDCKDATHKIKNIHQVGAPIGYTPAKGSINLCRTNDGWIIDDGVEGSKGDGSDGITFTPYQDDAHEATITFKNEKGPGDNYTGTTRYTADSGNAMLVSVASVEASGQEYGVNGIAYSGTIEVDTDGDGKLDKTIDIPLETQGKKEDGTPYTEIDLLNHSFDGSMWNSIEWRDHQTTATSCENSPARITLWETKAAAGYQPIQGKAVICATKDGWKQTVTPDGPTGWIKFDKGANLVRFASVKDTPGHAVDDTAKTPYGEDATLDVLKNDTASNGGTLESSTLTLLDKDGKAVNSLDGRGGTYTVENGKLVFKGAQGFTGEADAVSYQVKDSSGRILTATAQVTVENVTPRAVDDTASTKGATPVEISPLGNDESGTPAAPLAASTFKLSGDGNGTWSWDASTGKVKFTAKDGFSGDAKAEYSVKDILGNEVTATITVSVEKVDSPTTDPGTTTPTPTDPTTPPTTETPTPTTPGTGGTTPTAPETSSPTTPGANVTPDTPVAPGPVIQTDMVGGSNSAVGVAGFSALAILGGAGAMLRRRMR